MSTVKPKKESRSVLGRWWLVFGSCHVDDTACETKEEADLGFNESCHEAIVEVIAVTEHDRIVADYESRLTKMSRFNNDALDGQEKLEAELEIARAQIELLREQRNRLAALLGGGPKVYRAQTDSLDAEVAALEKGEG